MGEEKALYFGMDSPADAPKQVRIVKIIVRAQGVVPEVLGKVEMKIDAFGFLADLT